jgi:hypothetical protein
VGLKLNGTHQLVVYADDVNPQDDNTDTIEKNRETLMVASKEVDLEVNTEKIMYMLLTFHQNAGENSDTKTANRRLKNVAQFEYSYFGMTVINQNLTQEELKKD